MLILFLPIPLTRMIAAASGGTQVAPRQGSKQRANQSQSQRHFRLDLAIREWLDEAAEAKVMLT
jgi:hypothetical protein